MAAICVFCGSSSGSDPVFREAARSLGEAIAANGHELVYGGGHVGLMGVVADAALAPGGSVIGVMTEQLVAAEVAHLGLTDLQITPSMHARKALMAELSDAFIAQGIMNEAPLLLGAYQATVAQATKMVGNVRLG